MSKVEFERIGYYKDYYNQGKFWGSKVVEEPDREECGYYGRKIEILEAELVIIGKPTLPKGRVVTSELNILSGKIVKNTP